MIVLRLGWVCVQHFFDLDKYLYIYVCVCGIASIHVCASNMFFS